MAKAVAEALEGERSLAVEAGTGVGKSLAYLLPGALWALTHGRRLLVSTHTRALQEQLLEKDLPLAARVMKLLGHSLRYAMLQGADNYLCVQRLDRLTSSSGLFPETGAKVIEELSLWSRTAETGHRSALPCLVPQGIWSRISRDPDLCMGPGGRFWSSCLYRKDRERAERAHIVVVNHALLLSGARIPAHDALVIDEAHNLEDTAVSHFGLSVSPGRFAAILEEAKAFAVEFPVLERACRSLADETPLFFEELARAHGRPAQSAEPGGRLLSEKTDMVPPPALLLLEKALLVAAGAAVKEERQMELKLLQARASALRGDIQAILTNSSEDLARWIEWSERGVAIRAAPLEVAGRLSEGLFSRGIPVILTSATLSSGRGLRDFKAAVGCPEARELALDSPFDYPSQAGLLVMDDLPAPSENAKYVAAVAARCRKIIDAVPGGVLILFSSWRSLRAVHAKLKRGVKGRPLWMQGDTGHDALMEHFEEAGNAVLLGVDTFWQGVDVSGGALSCVVVVKLPFPNFGSPVEEARRKWFDSMGRGYFEDFSLPRAVMKFRQGFGRLIRSSTDRGAVVVLDSRIAKRGYGHAFLEALPRCRKLGDLDELAAFFGAQAELK
jgi:ATP-dependent DNA helicase DinG